MLEVPHPYSRLPAAIRKRPDLSSDAKVAWQVMAHLQQTPVDPLEMTQGELASEMGIPRRSLQRALEELKRAELLDVYGPRGATRLYQIRLPGDSVGCANLAQVGAETRARTAQDPRQDGAATRARTAQDPRQVGAEQITSTLRKQERGPLPSASASDSIEKQSTASLDGDGERLVAIAFPGGASEKQRAAVLNAAAEALRLGASMPLLAHAVRSRKANGVKPWERIEDAGHRARDLLGRASAVLATDFEGASLADVYEYLAGGGQIQKGAGEVKRDLRAWRSQVMAWPESAEVAAGKGAAPCA